MRDLEDLYGKFDFDPCPANHDDAFDGLSIPWGQNNFVNPPFNALPKWLEKASQEWQQGKQTVFLMPVRIHTEYFARIVSPHLGAGPGKIECYVVYGGMKFQGYKDRAPFGVMYLVFKPREIQSNSGSTQ